MSQPLRIATRASDRIKRQQLRRMKSVATGLLIISATIYLIAKRAEATGAPVWVSFVRAAAEAAMVGGLADWFAVTALFRRPLGLPIPQKSCVTKFDLRKLLRALVVGCGNLPIQSK